MYRTEALDKFRAVLDKIKGYVEEHDTIGDLTELNDKYVPAELRDDIAWAIEMGARLLDADPTDESAHAVEVPPVTAH